MARGSCKFTCIVGGKESLVRGEEFLVLRNGEIERTRSTRVDDVFFFFSFLFFSFYFFFCLPFLPSFDKGIDHVSIRFIIRDL